MKVDIFESSGASRVHSIPFYLQRISAGFPSPAQGYEKQELNCMSIVFVTLQQLTSCGFLARQWKMAASMMVTYWLWIAR